MLSKLLKRHEANSQLEHRSTPSCRNIILVLCHRAIDETVHCSEKTVHVLQGHVQSCYRKEAVQLSMVQRCFRGHLRMLLSPSRMKLDHLAYGYKTVLEHCRTSTNLDHKLLIPTWWEMAETWACPRFAIPQSHIAITLKSIKYWIHKYIFIFVMILSLVVAACVHAFLHFTSSLA